MPIKSIGFWIRDKSLDFIFGYFCTNLNTLNIRVHDYDEEMNFKLILFFSPKQVLGASERTIDNGSKQKSH